MDERVIFFSLFSADRRKIKRGAVDVRVTSYSHILYPVLSEDHIFFLQRH